MSDLAMSLDHRPLGGSGIMVSPVAWGMWRLAEADARPQALVEAALAADITLFDTADIYGPPFGRSEDLLGKVFADAPGLRAKIVLATKGGIVPGTPYDSSGAYLKQAVDASLRRLRVEQVDLYQIHRPDLLAHPQELARTLEDMVACGKARAIGVSNFTVAQTRALARFLTIPLASHQPEFSPLALGPITDGLLDLAMERDIAVLAWSPLGGGRIAKPQDARARAVAAALDAVAEEAGVSRAVAAYGWSIAHPARPIPIVGTQNPARIAELADLSKLKWTRKHWYDVLIAARGERLP